MIQDITPKKYHCEYCNEKPTEQDYIFAFSDDEVLFYSEDTQSLSIPRLSDLSSAAHLSKAQLDACRYLFSIDEERFFLIETSDKAELLFENPNKATGQASMQNGLSWKKIFQLRQAQPQWLGFAGLTAFQLSNWYKKNRFCGACGAKMQHDTVERMLKCPACATTVYPSIAPVVIVAVTDENRLLLTRYANRPYKNYALVAGFAEIGETLEDAARREVMEETGVQVENIRYYKSQPWGLTSSLLSGFVCQLSGSSEITLDEQELAEAVWMEREDIPATEGTFALTAEMIEAFREGTLDNWS